MVAVAALFSSPRNIYVAPNRMEIHWAGSSVGASKLKKPQFNIFSCELPNHARVPKGQTVHAPVPEGQVDAPRRHAPYDFNVAPAILFLPAIVLTSPFHQQSSFLRGSRPLRYYDGMAAAFARPPKEEAVQAQALGERRPICTANRECAVKCHGGRSCPAIPSHPFSVQVRSLAKAHGHCLSNSAHFAGARCTCEQTAQSCRLLTTVMWKAVKLCVKYWRENGDYLDG